MSGSKVETLPGGKSFKWTMKYVVHFTVPRWPVILEFKAEVFEIPNDLPGAIEYSVAHHGLTQEELWDAYRRADEDISVALMAKPWE